MHRAPAIDTGGCTLQQQQQ